MIGIEGVKLLFTKARSTGIYAISATAGLFLLGVVWYFIMMLMSVAAEPGVHNATQHGGPVDTATILIAVAIWLGIFIVYIAVSLLIFGVLEYAAAMIAQGKEVSLKQG